jgi:uncharacterized repeat protein (TIGR02543 family)
MKSFRSIAAAIIAVALIALLPACEWFISQRFTVSYDGNEETGGLAPVDDATYRTGAVVTVLGQNTLARTGYAFTGWNAAADGTGTARSPGDEFSMGAANVVLYAQWEALPSYSVSYNSNGASFGAAPADVNAYIPGAIVTVLGQGSLFRVDHAFAGWNTAATGTGTAYAENDAFAIGGANAVLYAQWTYRGYHEMIYIRNQATSGTVPVDAAHYAQNDPVTVLGAGTLARTDHIFDGWNTAADGSGTDYAAASSFNMGSVGLILYAQWFQPAVHFDSGGGSAIEDAHTVRIVSFPVSARSGWALEGWYPNASFNAGEKIAFPLDVSTDRTLYAHWIASTPGLAFTAVSGGYAVARGAAADSGAITVPAFWLGDPVTAVSANGFDGMVAITGVTLPASVQSIGTSAFYNCDLLVNVNLPEGITVIPENAFYGCHMLPALDIPDSVSSIDSYAFAYCTNLDDIAIPNGVTILSGRVFYACYGLNNISLPISLKTISNTVFGFTGLVTITLPAELETIGYGAFSECDDLTAIDIPATVTTIGVRAFISCDSLTTVHARRATHPVVQIQSGSLPLFDQCPALAHIYVPAGSVADYEGDAEWGAYAALIDEEP